MVLQAAACAADDVSDMDPATRLRQEFLADQKTAMRRARAQRRRGWFGGVVGGVLAALLAVAITVFVTRIEFFWHSFLLEIGLGALAGFLIHVTGGGLLKGVFLLPLSYAGAYLLRQQGYDPALWIGGPGSSVVIEGHGHLLAVCTLVGCGGVVGHIIESRLR
jgi:hypothetical protein